MIWGPNVVEDNYKLKININLQEQKSMNTLSKYLILGTAAMAWTFTGCTEKHKQHEERERAEEQAEHSAAVKMQDYGPEPTVLNIEDYTKKNTDYRQTLWTGHNLQLTLMTIQPGEDIGLELHEDIDQFLRIEEGEGLLQMGDTPDNLDFERRVSDDFGIFVPAGKWHNLINDSKKPLKLYSVYAPAEHPHGTVHKTRAEGQESHVH